MPGDTPTQKSQMLFANCPVTRKPVNAKLLPAQTTDPQAIGCTQEPHCPYCGQEHKFTKSEMWFQ